MSTFTQFYVYKPIDTITNVNLNGNIQNIVTAGNAIDRTNMADGSGIDASSMNPASGPAATFAGVEQYSFPQGLTSAKEIDFTGTSVSHTNVAIGSDGAATAGMILNIPGPVSGGIQLGVNGVNEVEFGTNTNVPLTGNQVSLVTQRLVQINGALSVAPYIVSAGIPYNVSGPAGPGYTNLGGAAGPTFHIVTGSVAGDSTVTVTLPTGGVFTSATTYAVAVCNGSNATRILWVQNLSGTQFTIFGGAHGGQPTTL